MSLCNLPLNHKGGVEYSSTLSVTSALDVGGWPTPSLGRLTKENDPLPVVLQGGWAAGSVWTGAGNLIPSRIRSPSRTAITNNDSYECF
jgi:hypothetical protein